MTQTVASRTSGLPLTSLKEGAAGKNAAAQEQGCAHRGLVYDALLLEELLRDVLGVFLLNSHLGVEFSHGLGVQARGDLVQDSFHLRVLLHDIAPNDGRRKVEGPDVLRVLHDHQLVGGELRVGGEADSGIPFTLQHALIDGATHAVYDDKIAEIEGRVV